MSFSVDSPMSLAPELFLAMIVERSTVVKMPWTSIGIEPQLTWSFDSHN